jgi:hypothetical protein
MNKNIFDVEKNRGAFVARITNVKRIFWTTAMALMLICGLAGAQPTITGVYPDGSVQFQPSPTLSFTANGSGILSVSVSLVGTNLLGQTVSASFTDTNGLTVSPALPSPSVTVSAPLASNAIYAAVIKVTDSSGVVSSVLSFDTITPTYTFEAEDFDYSDGVNAGLFFDQPDPLNPTPNQYFNLTAASGIDCTNGNPGSGSRSYRLDNNSCLETERASDVPRSQYVNSGFPDYDVGFSLSNNFANYTRTYPAGVYYIYMRGANGGNVSSNTASMNLVTSGRATLNQTIKQLGTFTLPVTGGGYQSYNLAPARDVSGNYVAWATPGDVETLREMDINGGENPNYYLLTPAAPILAPYVSSNIYFAGDNATLTLNAQALGTPAYQWQQSVDGVNWSNVGASTPAYAVPTTTLAPGGYSYRVILSGISITSPSATVTSAIVSLTIHAASAPIIFQDTTPGVATPTVGSSATFTASFIGNQPITNLWQVSQDGGTTWNGVPGATNTTLTVNNPAVRTNEYRLMAVNSLGTTYSTPAILRVLPKVGPVQLSWLVQPGSAGTGSPFGQQPTLITADANGNPSSLGLPPTLTVTVDTIPASALAGGPITFNMGSGGSNGVATFSGLQINTQGSYVLSAVCGNGVNPALSPTNGVNGCVLWLDASDTSTFSLTNGNLMMWGDKSGTLNNATNVTAGSTANTPTIANNASLNPLAFGGGQVVHFGGNNYLNVNLFSITNKPYSVLVFETLGQTVSGSRYFIGTASTPANNDNVLHVGYNSPTQFHFGQYGDDANYNLLSGTFTPGVPRDWLVSRPVSNQRKIYLNGALVDSETGGSFIKPVGVGQIGRATSGNTYSGDISEIIVYTNSLTTLQVTQMDNYLQNKWLGNLSSSSSSSPFFVANGGQVIAGIGFVQQPTAAVAGVTIAPSVSVIVTNSAGTGLSGIPVTLAVGSGTGTLNGTVVIVTDGSGVATYSDLNFFVAGTKQLNAVIGGAATNTSVPFVITAAAPAQIGIVTQPSSSAVAGVAFPTQPTVAVEDQYGNPVLTSTDTIVASQVAGGTISQTSANAVQVNAVNGAAVFSGINLTNKGVSALAFTDSSNPALPVTNSINITVAASAAATLTFQQSPSTTAAAGVVFDTQPIINAVDIFGNLVENGTAIVGTATPGPLLGATSVTTVGGVATFSGLSLTNTGGVTLSFTSGAASVTSPITVSVGPVAEVIWTTQPGLATNGMPFGQQPVLQTADAGGHVSTINLGATNMVVISLYSGSGLAGGPLTFNMGTDGSNGIATFQNLQINNSGANDVLAASLLGQVTSPTNVAAPCALWLDANDPSTLVTSNNTLVRWLDKSGTQNNATNTANYPTVGIDTNLPATAYGSQNVIQFGGSNWLYMSLSNLDLSPFTVIAIEVTHAFSGSSYYIGSNVTPPSGQQDSILHIGYNSVQQFHLGFFADDLNYNVAGFAAGVPRIWSTGLDGSGNQYIYLNGTQAATRVAGNYLQNLIGSAVGRGNGATFKGNLAEIVVFNQSLSDQDRQTVEQYLKYKWLSNSKTFSAPFAVKSTTATTPFFITAGSTKLVGSGASAAVQFSFTNTPGLSFSVCATNNLSAPLATWPAIGTATENPANSGQYQFVDPNSATNSRLFYILRQP